MVIYYMDLSQINIKGQNWKIKSYAVSNFIKVVFSISNYFSSHVLISNCPFFICI